MEARWLLPTNDSFETVHQHSQSRLERVFQMIVGKMSGSRLEFRWSSP